MKLPIAGRLAWGAALFLVAAIVPGQTGSPDALPSRYVPTLERYYRRDVLPRVLERNGGRSDITIFTVVAQATADAAEPALLEVGRRLGSLLPEHEVQFVTMVQLSWLPGIVHWIARAEIGARYDATVRYFQEYYADNPEFRNRPRELEQFIERTTHILPEFQAHLPQAIRDLADDRPIVLVLDQTGTTRYRGFIESMASADTLYREVNRIVRSSE